MAAKSGHGTIVKLLVDTGKIDVNSTDSSGRTPLSCAAADGHETIMKLLLDTEMVDVHLKNPFGSTPLSLAAQGWDAGQ